MRLAAASRAERTPVVRMALALALLWGLFLCGAALAAETYPALTGRIVDGARIIPAATAISIEDKLKALEDKSGIQLVVATVPSLGGNAIEPYANELFRAWKLGQAKANNGVLLLVAPIERKVRIEVGYGLEGTLTDALSSIIIANAMVPRFKTGDYAGGIEKGVDDIVTVLSTDQSEWSKRPDLRPAAPDSAFDTLLPFLFVLIVFVVVIYVNRHARRGGGGFVFLPTGGSGWGGGAGSFGSGGGDGGGFSGGGGSSGGGGASGGW